MAESIRIGIIDSGVHPEHPHVIGAKIAAGARIGLYQNDANDYLDFQGHGTAVAAAILSHCPEAELCIAKVFDKTLSTRIEVLLRAIAWCVDEQHVHWLNLSLGTRNEAHREALEAWTHRATIIAADTSLPGGMDRVVTVTEDPSLARNEFARLATFRFAASGRPRPIPGRAEHDNLGGVSFAVANLTGLAAKQYLLTRRSPWEEPGQSPDC